MNKIVSIFCVLWLMSQSAIGQIVRGADVGWLSEMEQSGRKWKDSLGVQRDLYDILDDYCINGIRLRVWVNPTGGWSGKQDVINLAKRAAAKGYKLMIDFHYSDSWADPGQQTKPAAWANYNITQLRQAVYDHTFDVLNGLKAVNVSPEWVQVGNETNDGMIWPDGKASTNMANYAAFVSKGYDAVKAVFPNAKVIVHVSNGFDNALFRWNIGGLITNGAKFDVVGMSMYPDQPADWATYASQTLTNMQDMITKYNKEIMVSEIGLATTAETEGKQFVEKVIQNLQSLPNKKGLGVFWWEPEAYNWNGYGKVAWNTNTQQATLAMKGFKYNCSGTTPIKDCNGVVGGTAQTDACGICVGGSTGKLPCQPVSVTFKLNTNGQTSATGFYITGLMTTNASSNWEIIPMQNTGNGIYTYTTQLMPNDTGAYYYMNANTWGSRETVPKSCATSYGTDRTYHIGFQNMIISDTWASCLVTDLMQNELVENRDYDVNNMHYEIYTMQGLLLEQGVCSNANELTQFLKSGVYLVKLNSSAGIKLYKILKE